MTSLSNVLTIARRELSGYFATPVGYVLLVAFAATAGALPFYAGDFLTRGQADLSSFFMFHPWLFLALAPAIGMRLWAEERRSGTIELLMSLPINAGEAVVGKFIAAWGVAGLALAATIPIWIAVDYLGSPDNGVIFANYVASLLLSGALLALSACASALTRNQIVAFIVGIALCGLMMIGSLDAAGAAIRAIAPTALAEFVASMSLLGHVSTIAAGVVDLRDVFYLLSFICLCLFVNTQIIELRRGR